MTLPNHPGREHSGDPYPQPPYAYEARQAVGAVLRYDYYDLTTDGDIHLNPVQCTALLHAARLLVRAFHRGTLPDPER